MLLGSSLSLEFSSSSGLVHGTDAEIYDGSRAISLNGVPFLRLGRARPVPRVSFAYSESNDRLSFEYHVAC